MGGSVSVQKNPKTTLAGSAAKYEDKIGESGSKASAKSGEAPLAASPARTYSSDTKGTISSTMVADAKTVQNNTAESIIVVDRNDAEDIPNIQESGGNDNGNGQLDRNNSWENSASQIALFSVGDCVQVPNSDGTMVEGLVLEIVDSQKVLLDIYSEGVTKVALASHCEVVVKSDVMEVGDQVQVQPVGSAMYFVGRLAQINKNGTYDVVMEGDDPDDIERNVPPSNIRKLMSRRALVVARWKRAALVVSSIHNFQSFVVDPNMFTASTRGTKLSAKIPEGGEGGESSV